MVDLMWRVRVVFTISVHDLPSIVATREKPLGEIARFEERTRSSETRIRAEESTFL